MKVLIVDTDREHLASLTKLLNDLPLKVDIVQSESAEEALFFILEEHPEIVIAEANLPCRSGFHLAQTVNKANLPIRFMVFSSKIDDAIEAIQCNVSEFFTKPIDSNKLLSAIRLHANQVNHSNSVNKILLSENILIRMTTLSGYVFIDLDNLAYVMADGTYSVLNFTDGSKEFSTFYLRKIEEILLPYHFIRISRSVLVNLKYLNMIDKRNDICRLRFNGNDIDLKITKSFFKHLEKENLI
jgi:two-component system, LytTR family, response regulator